MEKVDLLILTWHQVYLTIYAGGYIRIKELLKRIPSNLSYIIVDNTPSIYKKTVPKSNLIQYNTPIILKLIMKKFFILWFLSETLSSAFILYKLGQRLIKTKEIKVLYVPIGEFYNLYLPAIALKKRFPHIRLVVDILNYDLPDKNIFSYYKKLRKNGTNIFRTIIILLMYYVNIFFMKKTMKFVDYIFTVSPELVNSIKKDYKKESIDFTPSGVDNKFSLPSFLKKKYLGVYVGRITIEKGIFEVLQTWAKVIKKKPDAKLALAGYADKNITKVIKKKIEELQLEKNVIFFGSVSEKEKFEILSQSEVFLHLAKYEPLFPVIGILEGLSCGLPAVIYNMPVVLSQMNNLKPKKCIYIVENGNISEAANKILEYSFLPTAIKQDIFKEAKKYADLFDWDIIADKEFKIISK